MIFIIILILIVTAIVFVSIKVNNLKYRAEQHVLKNSGISSSELGGKFGEAIGKKSMENFLKDHTSYSEQSLKDILVHDTQDIFNRLAGDELSDSVVEKMQKDTKLDKMKTMEFKRSYLNFYRGEKLGAFVIYSDGNDEYDVFLTCFVDGENIKVDNYKINKGAVVGF